MGHTNFLVKVEHCGSKTLNLPCGLHEDFWPTLVFEEHMGLIIAHSFLSFKIDKGYKKEMDGNCTYM